MSTRSDISVRKAGRTDAPRMVEIMESNHHYYNPEVDGIEAIARQLTMPTNVILVAEVSGKVAGFLNGSWNGARAFIFKLSVDPAIQRRGVGAALVRAAAAAFREMGAVTIGVDAADGTGGESNNSIPFWESIGFELIPARLMIHFEIDRLLEG